MVCCDQIAGFHRFTWLVNAIFSMPMNWACWICIKSTLTHDDVIKWKHTPRYWPFVSARNSPVPGEFLAQRPVTWNIYVFFDLRLNKLLSKQPWGWWFETPPHPLWCHRNAKQTKHNKMQTVHIILGTYCLCQSTLRVFFITMTL